MQPRELDPQVVLEMINSSKSTGQNRWGDDQVLLDDIYSALQSKKARMET